MERPKNILRHIFHSLLFLATSSFSASLLSVEGKLSLEQSENSSSTLGVGENLYPCAHNHSVCNPPFACWRAPSKTSSFDRGGWTCPSGFVDGCICQEFHSCHIDVGLTKFRNLNVSLRKTFRFTLIRTIQSRWLQRQHEQGHWK